MRRAIPPAMQAFLDAMEPQIRDAFLKAVAQIKSAAQLRLVDEHLQSGNVEAAIIALRLDPAFFAPLDRALVEAYWQGGGDALALLPRLKDPFLAAVLSWLSTGGTSEPKNGQGSTSET